MKGKTQFSIILIFFFLICISQSKKLRQNNEELDPVKVKNFINDRLKQNSEDFDYVVIVVLNYRDFSVIASSHPNIKQLPKYQLTVNGKKIDIDEKEYVRQIFMRQGAVPDASVGFRIINRPYDLTLAKSSLYFKEKTQNPLHAMLFKTTRNSVMLSIRRFKTPQSEYRYQDELSDDAVLFQKYFINGAFQK